MIFCLRGNTNFVIKNCISERACMHGNQKTQERDINNKLASVDIYIFAKQIRMCENCHKRKRKVNCNV